MGTYVNKEKNMTFKITSEPELLTKKPHALTIELVGAGTTEIYPESDKEFFATEYDAQVSFIKDNNGQIKKAIVHLGNQDIEAEKT